MTTNAEEYGAPMNGGRTDHDWTSVETTRAGLVRPAPLATGGGHDAIANAALGHVTEPSGDARSDAAEAGDHADADAARVVGVLLVEDEAIVRTATERLLNRLGYKVFAANDGLHALEVFDAHRDAVHLVVLDLMMPRMGGRACFEALRQRAPALPVVICTGYGRDGDIEKILAAGASGVLHKPFTLRGLADIVSEALS